MYVDDSCRKPSTSDGFNAIPLFQSKFIPCFYTPPHLKMRNFIYELIHRSLMSRSLDPARYIISFGSLLLSFTLLDFNEIGDGFGNQS